MMSNRALFEQLFKEETASGSTDFLQNIAEAHPYFTPARFFLLKETATDAAGYAKEAAATSLLFSNPLWLSWQLQYGDKEIIFEETKNEAEAAQPMQETPAPAVAETVQVSDTTMPGDAAAAGATNETITKEEQLLFEPMHLVDYFASQGIKLTDEMQSADKLGKQLKSFTQWLKTMKKVHDGQLPEATGQAERVIRNLAEQSNAEEEVLTESMAEVFAIQGKHKKAIEVYEKLSLLNPSKSAYFAAKIAGTGRGSD